MNDFRYIIYSDGSCLGNPGVGGWASLIIDKDKNNRFLLSSSEKYTTNNRMELLGAINALEFILKNEICEQGGSTDLSYKCFNMENTKLVNSKKICVFSDSQYLCNGAKVWIHSWKKNMWKNNTIKNIDLWKRLDKVCCVFVNCISWIWVKAHHIDKNNIFVDCVARSEASFLSTTL